MTTSLSLQLEHIPSPLGTILLAWTKDDELAALDFETHEARFLHLLRLHHRAGTTLTAARAPRTIREPIEAFFSSELTAIERVRVHLGGTPFERTVWNALRTIPVGTTTSYGRLAASLGKPKASRAVGRANGANPVGIVVPCHRVIGADGSLTGYGGGIERKRWLLEHEGARARA